MQLNQTAGKELNARAAKSTYLVFGLLSLPFLFPVFVISRQYWGKISFTPPSDLLVVVFFPSIFLLVFVWIERFQITVSDSELSYRTLFSGTRTLHLSDVASVETELGAGKLLGPFYRLVIKNSNRPIIINMKVFERRDLEQLLSILGDKVIGKPKYSVFSKSE